MEKMRQAEIEFILTVHFLLYICSERCFRLLLLSEDGDSQNIQQKQLQMLTMPIYFWSFWW